MNLLFVCNFGQIRSRTAAELFQKEYDSLYAGLFSQEHPVTEDLIIWADKIFVVEEQQKSMIKEMFSEYKKDIINLDIPNSYFYNQPELKELIKTKTQQYLPKIRKN